VSRGRLPFPPSVVCTYVCLNSLQELVLSDNHLANWTTPRAGLPNRRAHSLRGSSALAAARWSPIDGRLPFPPSVVCTYVCLNSLQELVLSDNHFASLALLEQVFPIVELIRFEVQAL
jgi:hypothetical protein